MAPRKGLVSANLPTLIVLKVWVSVEKHQIKEMYHDLQSGIDIHQDQSVSLSPPSAAIHLSHSLLSSLPQLFTGHCACPLLLPPVFSATHSSFSWGCSCNLSPIRLQPSGASSKWHLFQKVFLDPPARSTHYLFSMPFQTIRWIQRENGNHLCFVLAGWMAE